MVLKKHANEPLKGDLTLSKKHKEEELKTEVIDDVEIVETNDFETQLQEKQSQIDEYVDKLQRTLAEFDNFRKRTLKEKASMYDDGAKDTVEKLLPVIDNFERAIASIEDKTDSFYVGFEMILKQFKEILDSMGVKEIAAVGESFDTNLHFAVAHVEDDTVGENTVVDVMQKGYMFKEKVIRCSMVKVAN